MVSVVQTADFGAWSGSLGAPAATGNTLLLFAAGFNAGAVASSNPLYGGSSVAGAAQLWGVASGSGSSQMYSSCWMLPNLPSSSASVAITVLNASVPTPDGGLIVLEVAGLGASPSAGAAVTGSAQNGNASAGPVTAASGALVAAHSAIFGSFPNGGPASPWTDVSSGSIHAIASYQVAAGGSYTWTETGNGSPWAAGIVAVSPSGSAPVSRLLMGSII